MEADILKEAAGSHIPGWAVFLIFTFLGGLLREMLGFVYKMSRDKNPNNHDHSMKNILENQTKLLAEQKEILSKVSSVLDFYRETLLSVSRDIIEIKARK